MASDFACQLTEKAEADLEEIVSYIAVQLENPQAAAGFLNTLQNAIQEACSFPESGTLVVNDFLPQKNNSQKAGWQLYYVLFSQCENGNHLYFANPIRAQKSGRYPAGSEPFLTAIHEIQTFFTHSKAAMTYAPSMCI